MLGRSCCAGLMLVGSHDGDGQFSVSLSGSHDGETESVVQLYARRRRNRGSSRGESVSFFRRGTSEEWGVCTSLGTT